LYVPLNCTDAIEANWIDNWRNRDLHFLSCYGRLRQGVSIEEAQANLGAIYRALAERYPEDKSYGVRVISMLDSETGDYAATLWVLMAAVVCLLLLSSANVAGLLLARGLDRKREMSIRASLGASRWTLLRQLLLETLLLALPASVVGSLIAAFGIELIKKIGPQNIIRLSTVSLDSEALLLCLVLALFSAVLVGIYPAFLESKTDLIHGPKDVGEGRVTAGRAKQRIRSILVAGQVALASVFVVSATLIIRSFLLILNLPLGFNGDHVVTTGIYLLADKYRDPANARVFFDTLLDRVRQLPGVTDASLNSGPPFVGFGGNAFTVDGLPVPDVAHAPRLAPHRISPRFFATLRIPFLEGRDFDSHDSSGSQPVIIIDKALAERWFPNGSPLGRQIQMLDAGWKGKKFTIVGVAQSVTPGSPDFQEAYPRFTAYFPYSQQLPNLETLLVRATVSQDVLVTAIRRVAAAIDPDVPLTNFASYNELIGRQFVSRQLGVCLAALVSGIALVLSAVGLYGTLAYSVSQRTREIGVRIALGARVPDLLRLIIGKGLRLVCIGLTIGILAASVSVRLIQGMLYGVSVVDPITFGICIFVLILAALFACLPPTLHAMRINPITALRE
jgi:predicted permease